MSVKKLRDDAVSRALGNIRQIEEAMGVGYYSLKKIRSELNELSSDKSLFPRAHFPVSDSGESVVYRLSEDDDHRFALYGSVGTSGKEVSPHNHTTWAVIVGVHGQEFNRFYERTDDRSGLGKAVLKETGDFVVTHGNGVVFMPDDIHSISTEDAESTLHLHMYGMALDHLHQHLVFNREAQSVSTMPIRNDIQDPLG